MRKTSVRKRLLVGAAALSLTGVGLVIAGSPAYSSVSTDSGFEAADGDLEPNAATQNFDWNSFSPVTWTDTAPYRRANKTTGVWEFDGLEDAQNSGADTVFAGGVKQDDDCATVQNGPKPPNKDDLKRAYLNNATIEVDEDPGAGETLADHVFLNLGWVRIPQNTTSASAHVAFEFNQAERDVTANLCDTTKPDGLLKRTAGDMLVVYDFEGSSTDRPAIKLLRWLSGTYEPSWSCEVAKSRPCWGNAQILTALDPPVAEAKVNTSDVANPVLDKLAPGANENLGQNEFGEAGIDLTAADVFTEGECVSFGSVYAVSRSSGNSGQAQMKDIVGPGDISLNNCGGVIIRKVTDPSPDQADPDTEFGFTTTGGLLDEDGDADKFSLSDGDSQDYGTEVLEGSYTVAEDDPSPDYVLTDIDCSDSSITNGTTVAPDLANRTLSIDLKALDQVDCTFTNTLQRGALRIQKMSTKSDTLVSTSGAVFSVDGPDAPEGDDTPDFLVEDNALGDTSTDPDTVADETGDDGATENEENIGEICVSGLLPGDYTVEESTPPDGYAGATEDPVVVTVVNGTDCDENLPDPAETGYTAVGVFSNAPLADIQVNFRDGGSGETSLDVPISCVDADENATLPTGNTTTTTGWDDTLNVPGIPIDPSPRTVVCTIVIDP